MTIAVRNMDVSRRSFMVGAAGLTFAVASGLRPGEAAARSGEVTMNAWVTISTDGTVAIMSPAAEMGQGSLTSLPLILAEELDADWAKVKIVSRRRTTSSTRTRNTATCTPPAAMR
jgi:isoquinoline 1-oxidoreductase beta subunit